MNSDITLGLTVCYHGGNARDTDVSAVHHGVREENSIRPRKVGLLYCKTCLAVRQTATIQLQKKRKLFQIRLAAQFRWYWKTTAQACKT